MSETNAPEGLPSAVRSNDLLGLVERMQRNTESWLPTSDHTLEAYNLLIEGAAEIERLRADLKAMEGFADLWYFVMDEAPREFERIVSEWSPASWMDEAAKLRTAKRAA